MARPDSPRFRRFRRFRLFRFELALVLGLLAAAGGLAAVPEDDARITELRAAIEAATDERGVPTPAQFDLRVELARLHLEAGDEDAAAGQLRVAAELGTLGPDLTMWLARRELADGRVAAAAHHLRSVVERAESSEAAYLLAEIAQRRGRHKVALGHARQAASFAGSGDELHRALSLLLDEAEAVGAYSDAADTAQQLMELEPEEWRHPWRLAGFLASQGQSQEAVEVLGRSVELADARGDDAWPARRDLGLALVEEDRYEEARPHLDAFLASHPADHDAQAAMAQVEERLGDAAAAASRARRVLGAAPGHAGALLVMGRIHAAAGDFGAAREALEASLAGDPESKKAHYQLSLACARLGDRECAERHLARYRQLQDGGDDVVEMTLETGDGGGR